MKLCSKLLSAAALMFMSYSSSAAFINFDSVTVDSYGNGQDKIGSFIVADTTLGLTGNVWKSVAGTYVITENTLLNFEIFSTSEGEINGIGLTNGSGITGVRTFQIAGTANYGNNTFDTYNIGDLWSSFSIDIGSFYTGTFNTLFFIMDDDSGFGSHNVSFRNVELCENGQCMTTAANTISAPGAALTMLLGFALLLRRVRK